MRNFLVLLLVGLVVYTVVDVTRSERAERFGIPQAIWIILILLFPLVGSIAWLALSRSVRNRPGGPPRDGGGGRRSTSPAPRLGPDDDPEFLWRLEQRQREAKRNNAANPNPDDDGSDQDPADPRGTTP